MGFGISGGAYLITHTKTLGGTDEYDLVVVIGGRGTVSEPWKVRSTITCRVYTVSAMEIIRESYSNNYSLADAEPIYKALTNKTAEEPKKPTINLLDIHPF